MANSIQDIAGNKLADDISIVLHESPDIIMPGVQSATVELTTGVVTILVNETVDVTPPENVNLTAISFVGSGKNLPMTGSDIDESDDVFLSFKMPESTRVASILNSNTPGGDGSTQTLTLLAGSIRDIATNLLPIDNTFISLTEITDFGNPVITSIELNYSTGLVTITCNETIDGVPSNFVNRSRIFLSDNAGARQISLEGSITFQQESPTISILLTELQRVTAIPLSGTQGGDGNAVFADFDHGALRDMATNRLDQAYGVPIVETRDSVIPTLFNATINYSTGILVIRNSETVDMTQHPGSI